MTSGELGIDLRLFDVRIRFSMLVNLHSTGDETGLVFGKDNWKSKYTKLNRDLYIGNITCVKHNFEGERFERERSERASFRAPVSGASFRAPVSVRQFPRASSRVPSFCAPV